MKAPKLETAIILLPEVTKGMKSIGSKALLNIANNVTILDHQIHYLKKHYNPEQIILCTGFDHDRVLELTKKYKNIKYYFHNNYTKENQAGSLIECIKYVQPKDALILTNGVILFNKIKLQNNSSTYFILESNDKKHTFDIGTNNINDDGYLFYDLSHKWIELLYLNQKDLTNIKHSTLYNKCNKLFLFEFINELRPNHNIEFILLNNIHAFKINSLKDITYAKKIYKKYSSILC